MHKDDTYTELLETLWRRELTEPEATKLRAWLTAHPEVAEEFSVDQRLTRALTKLKDKPVSPDFTVRVLEAVERDVHRSHPVWDWLIEWVRRPHWLPKAALAMLVLALCIFGMHQYRVAARARLAESVAVLANIEQLPSPEVLIDYDTIRRFSQLPPPDTELLALLK